MGWLAIHYSGSGLYHHRFPSCVYHKVPSALARGGGGGGGGYMVSRYNVWIQNRRGDGGLHGLGCSDYIMVVMVRVYSTTQLNHTASMACSCNYY